MENNPANNSCCPRCDSDGATLISESPVAGAWEIKQCPVCLFAWRSTEPINITSGKAYAKAFKINPENIGQTPMFPRIPPLTEP